MGMLVLVRFFHCRWNEILYGKYYEFIVMIQYLKFTNITHLTISVDDGTDIWHQLHQSYDIPLHLINHSNQHFHTSSTLNTQALPPPGIALHLMVHIIKYFSYILPNNLIQTFLAHSTPTIKIKLQYSQIPNI